MFPLHTAQLLLQIRPLVLGTHVLSLAAQCRQAAAMRLCLCSLEQIAGVLLFQPPGPTSLWERDCRVRGVDVVTLPEASVGSADLTPPAGWRAQLPPPPWYQEGVTNIHISATAASPWDSNFLLSLLLKKLSVLYLLTGNISFL